MGIDIHRVTSTTVICTDGLPANVAIYAYRPTNRWGSEGENAKMAFRAGVPASHRLLDSGRLTGRIVLGHKVDGKYVAYPGEAVFAFTGATYYDCDLGSKNLPVVEGARAPGEQVKFGEVAA